MMIVPFASIQRLAACMRRDFPGQRPGPKCGFVLLVILLLTPNVRAADTGIPVKLVITPSTIREDGASSSIKTRVTLQRQAPCYFICELRSSNRRQLSLTDIIFKKGDLEGAGTGKVDWIEVSSDGSIQVSAFSVDAPEKKVSVTVVLQKRREDAP